MVWTLGLIRGGHRRGIFRLVHGGCISADGNVAARDRRWRSGCRYCIIKRLISSLFSELYTSYHHIIQNMRLQIVEHIYLPISTKA